ncbi:site-specific integrase [Pseudomonas sp. Irchel s3b2]|uniref:site-specific integrase n=1 Tax=Pseudomonas sp. Irchel s3b2 TaxID=2009073 RepID=UPI000BA3F4F5|nr:site-specific integrase [Pseudomonas sp. Irchel s3b2]
MAGKFTYTVLPRVTLFEKTSDLYVLGSIDTDCSEKNARESNYKTQSIEDENGRTILHNIPVILNPDGSIWKHGSLYILSRAMCYDPVGDQTLKTYAKNLVDFRNTLAASNVDYLSTPLRRHWRPTYFYKSELYEKTQQNTLGIRTANGRIGTVIGLYRYLKLRHDFHPTQNLWEEKQKKIHFTNSKGFQQDRTVIVTDLKIKYSEEIPSGEYIIDGGKLIPYDEDQQKALIKVLFKTKNTEIILGSLIAITSGARLQTAFTLRHENIQDPKKIKGKEVSILIGRGTNVDNKFNKKMHIYIPAWLNSLIYTYIHSARHKERCDRFDKSHGESQYIFLTQHGNPFYISKKDERRGADAPIQDGYSIRQFVHKSLAPILESEGATFKFRFHNLRATFCMNLLEDKLRQLSKPQNTTNIMLVLGFVQKRMGHKDIATTERYLRYKHEKALAVSAQSEFETHLQAMAQSYSFQ